jgi:hypothetical protein
MCKEVNLWNDQTRKDADRIAASLIATKETNMGLGANTEHNLKIAKKIVSAKRAIIG